MNKVIVCQAPKTGYAYAVHLPYRHLPFVTAFKELVPEPARDWHPSMASWLFRRDYLEPVRQLVARFAGQEGWRIVDCVAMTKEDARRALEALDQQLYEEHVQDALGVLGKIPFGALALAGWFDDRIVLDLYERLDDPDLFRALMRLERPSSMTGGQPYVPGRSSRDPRVILAADARLIGALHERRVRNLQFVATLTPVGLFEDEIAHFHDEEGSLWFGAPPALALARGTELYEPTATYQIALADGDRLYLVARAEDYLPRLFRRTVSPGIVVLTRFRPRVPLGDFLAKYHLREWFVTWAGAVLSSEQVQAARSSEPRDLWESSRYWTHLADSLLAYLQATHSEDVQALLGWSDDFVRQRCESIGQQKRRQQRAYLLYCQEHAIELAGPLLERRTRDELHALGERYHIAIRSSWPIARRIGALLSQGEQSRRLAWDLLGIPVAPG